MGSIPAVADYGSSPRRERHDGKTNERVVVIGGSGGCMACGLYAVSMIAARGYEQPFSSVGSHNGAVAAEVPISARCADE